MRILSAFIFVWIYCANAFISTFPPDRGLGVLKSDSFNKTLTIEKMAKTDTHRIHFTNESDTISFISWKREFEIDTFMSFRFVFSFDSLFAGPPLPYNKTMGDPRFSLFSIISDDGLEKPFIESFLNLSILNKSGNWYLYTPFIAKDGKANRHILHELHKDSLYCIEISSILTMDSTLQMVRLFVNDKEIQLPNKNQGKRISHFICRLGNTETGFDIKGDIKISSIAFGNRIIGMPPLKPSSLRKGIIKNNGSVIINYLTTGNRYYSRIQIKKADSTSSWSLPIYDSGIDSANNDSTIIQIRLDKNSGWIYRLRYYTKQGVMSDWSNPVPIERLEDDSTMHPIILSAAFHDTEDNRPVKSLIVDRWYDLVVKASFPKGFNERAIFLGWVNSEDYTLGSPSNKGGCFLSNSSYIYNFSFYPDKAFEKNIEGKFKSQRLIDTVGSYIDFRKDTYHINDKDSSARFRVKIKSGSPGLWSFRCVAFDRSGDFSPVYMSTFDLTLLGNSTQKKSRTNYIVWILGSMLLIVIIITVKKKTTTRLEVPAPQVSSYDRELFSKLQTFLKDNSDKDLKIGFIEDSLGISHGNLYLLVKKVNGKTLKQLILDAKMDKAKELFEKTDMNVTEVMYKVGFSSPSHFTKVFRKHTGMNPKQFSKL
ncbi:MAG: helix-turn-helix transcriptional regulator [Fibrobacteres bacterium]|nr:helix-turn-helix transcriptional regulator [Fibrobacterota bacterium]